MKITPTMRRMVQDNDYFVAIAQLIDAQDKLREIELKRRGPPRQRVYADALLNNGEYPILAKARLDRTSK
jgi:hypothetical protein